MKKFIIEEKFVGYADITIEAETEEQAIQNNSSQTPIRTNTKRLG